MGIAMGSIRDKDVVAIPKSVHPRRIDENHAAAQVQLSAAELARLDEVFTPQISQTNYLPCKGES